MTTLDGASKQWAERPADQRFNSLADLHAKVTQSKAEAVEVERPYRALSVSDADGSVVLSTEKGAAELTHWSFGQLARNVGAPANYLRSLPASLAAENLTHGLRALVEAEPGKTAAILIGRNGQLKVRALTSERYTRIYNSDITARLLQLAERSPFQPAPAAFDGSRGLYASDQDMFAFLVDNSRRIFESLPGGGLSRGFFVSNSEVGAASFAITTFLYEYICGNHLVWGAKDVAELRIRHIGRADDRAFSELRGTLTRYADASEADDVTRIKATMAYSLGRDKDAVLDRVFGLRIPALSRSRIGEAYALAEAAPEALGNPTTAWGFAQGVTRLSQQSVYADARVELDRAAGKVLDLAF